MDRALISIVTGASSGIGRETGLALKRRGCVVYDLSRHDACSGLRHLYADVTDPESILRAVNQVLAETGRVDVLVNCAGMGISGAAEFTQEADLQRQFDVNFFGLVRTCQAVIPAMRAQGGGRIVNVSSVAALTPIPFQSLYSASKAAINSFTMALDSELRPFGIRACAVMPGDIRTGFTDARRKSEEGDQFYEGRITRSVSKMERDERSGMAPEAAGDYLAKVALARHVRPLQAIGLSYKAACVAAKLLPASLANRILFELYGK